jgi:isopropylmalate/homocitrate/citramalate synthase
MKKIKILDCTLREGEQSPGICFSVQEKIIIAEKLKEFGVDVLGIRSFGLSPIIEDEELKLQQNWY